MLGHHRYDIVETFFVNLFHRGRLAAMSPKLLNEKGDVFVYRPFGHVAEADCKKFTRDMRYPIIPCDLCGPQHGLQQQQVKQILDGWEANSPSRQQAMFRALMNARPSYLLGTKLLISQGLLHENKTTLSPQLNSKDFIPPFYPRNHRMFA